VLFFIFLYELLNFPVAVFSVSSKCNFSFHKGYGCFFML
jgi:hypothetical protein